jgi:DNA-binding transcriptional ArsR family regulator
MKEVSPRKRTPVPQKTPTRRAAARQDALALLQSRAEDAAALLKALANADRLLLLCHLVEAERSVGTLGSVTGIAQPTLSQQLGVLRTEGLVATRREGKSIFYRIASPAVHAVLKTLYELFCAEDGPALH